MSILEVKNLKYKYDKYDDASKYAIDDISFNIDEKDPIFLICCNCNK